MISKDISRKTVYPIVGILAAITCLGLFLLVRISTDLDLREMARSREFVARALEQREEALKRAMSDYASWGQAYQHLHVNFDFDWAFTQQNVGPSLYSDLGIDYLSLFDPDGREIYSIDRGKLAAAPLGSLIQGDIGRIVGTARAGLREGGGGSDKSAQVGGIGFIGGDPVLLVAGPVTPGGDTSVAPMPGPPSILVMGDRLDPDSLGKIGAAAFVPRLRIADGFIDARREPHRVLASMDGVRSAVLRWEPEKPGTAVLETVGPWVAGVVAFVSLLVGLLVRHAKRAIAAYETKNEELDDARREADLHSRHDETTGLLNRKGFVRVVDERCREQNASFGLVLVDLDRFRLVNDAFGHNTGDVALREIANRIRGLLPKSNAVGRIGGDEFALVVDDVDPVALEALCAQMARVIARPIGTTETELGLSVSIGVAIAPTDASTGSELMRCADIALDQAQADGCGTHRFFSQRMNERIVTRQKLEQELRLAIRDKALEVHYQPQVDAQTLRLCGAEALVRWRHPKRGLLAPNEFIPTAEETGLIVPLGEFVLETACIAALDWPGIRVAVNLSPTQFRDQNLVGSIERILDRTGIEPGRVELELTESVLVEDRAVALATLGALRKLGVHLALDDFGSGYSSLNYLRMFPFSRLKIDRAFIADLKPAGEARAIVRAIIDLGRSLGMEVVAEGVEAIEQLLILRADHCGTIQGYYTGRPMSEAAFRSSVICAEREARSPSSARV